MSIRDELTPPGKPTVMELVQAAGLDVSDWANFEGGQARAAMNPRYCYEWAFLEPGRVAVLNLWLVGFREQDGRVTAIADPLRRTRELEHESGMGAVAARARRMDAILETAHRTHLPLRVIVLAGRRRGHELPHSQKSVVTGRMLDPTHWVITGRDADSGDWHLARGIPPSRFADQFSALPEGTSPAPVRTVTGQVRVRSAEIRSRVLLRAQGICEWCGKPGFLTVQGDVYLETHHIKPLSEDGADHEKNVIALCPNDHREAHHGANRETMRVEMTLRVRDSPSS
jgi:hypothetical protein